MANTEMIDEVFNLPALKSQKEEFEKYIQAAADSLELLSIQANETYIELGKVNSLKDMITLTNNATNTNKVMADTLVKVKAGVKELSAEQIKANITIKEHNDLLKQQVAAEVAPAGSIAKVRAEAALLRNELMKLNLEKEIGRQQDIKNQLAQKDAFIKRNVDGYTAQKINIGNYPQGMTDFLKIREEMEALASSGQKDSAEFSALAEKAKEYQAALGGITGESRVVITSMQQLAAEGKADSEEFEMLAKRAAELKAQMNMVGMAVEEAGAKSERGALAMEHVAETLKEIGKFAIAFFGMQAGLEFIEGVTEEFGNADKAARGLKNTLENVGSANMFGKLSEESEELSNKLKGLDGYEVQGVFSKLITYGKLTEEQIKEAMPVIIDFAAKTGQTVEASTDVIVKALEGSSKGLKEFGINIKEAKTATGEALPQAERFGFIMEQLKPRVEGAAQAFNGGFTGAIAGIKKGFREAELAIADFFVWLSRAEEKQFEAAVSAKKEANETQALLDEYEKLTDKLKQTATDKKRLQDITSTLAAEYGNSVTKINEETGALELNIEATKDLIKQKILLANTEASTHAMKFNSADENIKKNTEELTKAQAALNQAIANTGITMEKVDKKLRPTSRGAGGAGDAEALPSLTPSESQILSLYQNAEKYRQAIGRYTDIKKEELEKLEALGFKEEDISKLFAPGSLKNNPFGDPSGGKKAPKDKTVESEKALNTALAEQYALNMKAKAAEQKAIVDEDLESYQVRKQALKDYNDFERLANLAKISNDYSNKQLDITSMKPNKDETDKSFKARKETANVELINIEKQFDAAILESKKQLTESLKKLDEETIQSNLDNISQIDTALETNKAKEIEAATKQYKRSLIDKEEYEKKKQKIEEKYTRAALMMHIAYYKQLIADSKEGDPDTGKYKAALQGDQNKLDSLGPAKSDKSDNPALAAMGLSDDDWENAQKVASGIMSLEANIMKLVDQKYQQEIANLEHKKQLIDENYNAEVAAINGSLASEAKKQRQIAVLAAQKHAADKKIDQEIRAEKRKMAIADKVANLSKAIEGTAVAVVTALGAGPYIGEVLAAIVGAAGAAEIAMIASTPLPQYGTGTEDHPGGEAIIGELNKPEWVFEPGKSPYMVDRYTRKHLAKHTRVIPEQDLVNGSMAVMPDGNLYFMNGFSGLEGAMSNGLSALSGKMDTLTHVVANKRETHFSWNNGELVKSVKNGNQWTEYLERNFS